MKQPKQTNQNSKKSIKIVAILGLAIVFYFAYDWSGLFFGNLPIGLKDQIADRNTNFTSQFTWLKFDKIYTGQPVDSIDLGNPLDQEGNLLINGADGCGRYSHSKTFGARTIPPFSHGYLWTDVGVCTKDGKVIQKFVNYWNY